LLAAEQDGDERHEAEANGQPSPRPRRKTLTPHRDIFLVRAAWPEAGNFQLVIVAIDARRIIAHSIWLPLLCASSPAVVRL
jgi:hypothetical protein